MRKAALVAARLRRVDQAHRHPLVVGLQGHRDALGPGAFGAFGVVRGAVAPRVVGDLVVVPDRDHRMLAMHLLQVGVALVLRVARAVVGQRDGFGRRLGRAQAAETRPGRIS